MACDIPRTVLKKNVSNCLQILNDEGMVTQGRKLSDNKPRPRSGGNVAKKAPRVASRSHSASDVRTCTTPTKQVLLTATRRKSNVDEFDTVPNGIRLPPIATTTKAVSSATAEAAKKQRFHQKDKKSREADRVAMDTAADAAAASDSSSDDESVKAPTELLAEFIDCVMRKDYINAQKLCKMILIYEPDNAEALSFQPLIEQKLVLEMQSSADDNEYETESESESERDDDSSDEDEDQTSSDETDDDRGSDRRLYTTKETVAAQ